MTMKGGDIAKLSRGTTSEYKLFNYTYQSSTRTLTATCVADQTTFTIGNMYVENGKLNITITLNGTKKVLSDGTKVEDDGSNFPR